MKTKTTNWGLPSRIRLRYLPTGKLVVVSFICSMLISFFHPSVFGQCDPPDLAGVPDGVVIEESYVKLSTTQTLFPSSKSLEDYSDLDHAITKETTLIEKFFHGIDELGNPLTIRQVLNPSSYFPKAVYPYTHAILHKDVGQIYNGMLNIYSFDATLPIQEDIDLEDEYQKERIENEYNINWNDNGLISFQKGNTKVTIDTLNNHRISSRFNDSGEIDMVHFVQNDPVDRNRVAPIYEIKLEKTHFIDTDGNCTYELTEDIYSDYCRIDTSINESTVIKPRSATNKLRPDVNVHVYPNPAFDLVNINLSQNQDQVGKLLSIEILNAGGQVFDVAYSATTAGLILQTSHLPTGLYVIRLRTTAKTFISKILKL